MNSNTTKSSRLRQRIFKHTKPPDDEGSWHGITSELMGCEAFRSLSINAFKALFTILCEHVDHGLSENGNLHVSHKAFITYGVSSDSVADAIEELTFKGLIRVLKGRGGFGTAHPNIFRLTFTGDHNGAPATNEWKSVDAEKIDLWKDKRKEFAEKRKKKANIPKNSPLGNLQGLALGKYQTSSPQIRETPSEKPAREKPGTLNILARDSEAEASRSYKMTARSDADYENETKV